MKEKKLEETKLEETELITQSIRGYLNMENIHSAIMLTGEWGCGKSFYVKNTLKKELEDNENKIVINISLYGLDKVEDINNAVRKKYLSGLGKAILDIKEETDEKLESKKLLKKAFGGLAAFIPGGEIISKVAGSIGGSIIELLQATEITPEINGKQVLLVFDDFERSPLVKSGDIQVLMGLINEYAENNKVKVLVVAYEDEIKDKDYAKSKEKFICETIEYNVDFKEQLLKIIDKFYEDSEDYNKLLKKYFDRYPPTDKNMRIYIFAFEKHKKIFDFIIKENLKYQEEDLIRLTNIVLNKVNEYKKVLSKKEDEGYLFERAGFNNILGRHIDVFIQNAIWTKNIENGLKDLANKLDELMIENNTDFWIDFYNNYPFICIEQLENEINTTKNLIKEDKLLFYHYMLLLVVLYISTPSLEIDFELPLNDYYKKAENQVGNSNKFINDLYKNKIIDEVETERREEIKKELKKFQEKISILKALLEESKKEDKNPYRYQKGLSSTLLGIEYKLSQYADMSLEDFLIRSFIKWNVYDKRMFIADLKAAAINHNQVAARNPYADKNKDPEYPNNLLNDETETIFDKILSEFKGPQLEKEQIQELKKIMLNFIEDIKKNQEKRKTEFKEAMSRATQYALKNKK